MFYEQIDERPPLHLRLLLPLRADPDRELEVEVGDEVRCWYKGGHLLKRITQIDMGRHYGFEAVEQSLAVGGGWYCRAVATRSMGSRAAHRGHGHDPHMSIRRPGWLWKPIEAAVCHMFHRHLLAAMRRKVESA